MSATDVKREERREEIDVGRLLDRVEEQVRQGKEVDLDAVSHLKPEDAKYLVSELEKRILRYSKWHELDSNSRKALIEVKAVALPSLADYVKEKLGVEMPLIAGRGWTDKVKEALEDIAVKSPEELRRGLGERAIFYGPGPYGDDYVTAVVSWERFKEILRHVPATNLLDRQNDSPPFIDFVEAAASVPGSYLSVHVVGKSRNDERVTIDGIILPVGKDSGDVVQHLLRSAVEAPDDVMFIEDKGRQYVWLRWD